MPGLRGVGKTTILLQLYNYLLNVKKIPNENILYVSMDQISGYFDISLLKFIDTYLENIHNTTQVNLEKKLFIFVDECHYDKQWGLSGKIIYDNTKNIFLIFTGSSAIEMEINADIVRRISKQTIYPNNFKDYLKLKHDIKTEHNFSKSLEDLIYFGEEKYSKKAIHLEKKVYTQLTSLNNYPHIEFNNFLKTYGLASTLKFEKREAYREIVGIINKVIENDIPSIKSFNTSTNNSIKRVIFYLALQRPGSTSIGKIANYLSISPKLVHDILDALEKTQLVFSVKPFGGAGSVAKKPWNYYFLSPSLKSAINYDIGRFNLDNKKCLGALAENYVASSLLKMNQRTFSLMGLFYSTEKKGPDFILRTKLDDIVPVEVGIGRKTKSQIAKAINKYNCKYGILISNRHYRIKYENNIIYIPLTSFGFL
jgi:predicted AAA+ superfamily ATPase